MILGRDLGVIAAADNGKPQRVIAEMFGISQRQVSNILRKHGWQAKRRKRIEWQIWDYRNKRGKKRHAEILGISERQYHRILRSLRDAA